ncbi:MAG: TRAP transporter permease [Desulfovibrio sp.]|jgi:TRAP transporter 4TM/12TM fusion protein|nr:TRAP transporter permease [Desulfovibrio sp.]
MTEKKEGVGGEAAPDRSDSGGIDFDKLMRQYDTESRFRILSGSKALLVTVVATSMSFFHIYTAGFGLLNAQTQGAVHLAFALCLTFLLYPVKHHMGEKHHRLPLYDFILAGLAAAASLYLVVNFEELSYRSGLPTDMDLLAGFLLIVLLLEATRRISNPVLSCLAILALLYCHFGAYLPDSMGGHRGFSVVRIINHMYLGGEGIFGTPLEVSSTYVFMFILFGSVLEKTGIGRFIIDLSLALAGWSSGGPAKVAVVASGLMGTVSGSSVANVCTTGMFTIPLMKSVGYRPYFAGAVEAVASTGGQIMPPVMGAGAFIMAQFLGVPYNEVVIAAVVPALLYFTAVLVQVHFEAKRLGLLGLPRERLPSVWFLLRTKGFLLLPLAAIIYLLLAGYTPLKAAFYGILTCIALSWLHKETRLTPKKLVEAFEAGARSSLAVACACACVGMIIGAGTLTGLALRIANGIVTLAQGMLLPTMLMTMMASILLGMGLPTTANFIVTSTMAAPALLQLGVPPMAAYMFVFYFGIAADLTPPVALAAYAGAGIAGADPMRTGVTAFKLALAGFIVPYIYVFNPILLFIDATPLSMVQAVLTALLGVFLLAMGSIGHFRATLSWPLRMLALIGAVGMLDPGTVTDIIGLVILALILFIQGRKAKISNVKTGEDVL